MWCKNCGDVLMEMYECLTDYHDSRTVMLTERYQCPNCKKRVDRMATYELTREWEKECDED